MKIIYTHQIVYKSLGVQRHVLQEVKLDGKTITVCGMEVDENWVWGDNNPPTSTDRGYWCKKCFPDQFTLIHGRQMRLNGS